MIHLIIRLPLPYQETLCQTLSDAYGGQFVAWFAERKNEDFPYRAGGEPRFVHRYLSEVGYWQLFKALRADPEALVILGGWSSPMTTRTLLITTLLRIPIFIWADHPHPRKRRWLAARFRKLFLGLLAWRVSGFLACGNPTVEHLASLGIERKKITNFPYWVELPPQWSLPERCLDDEAARRPLRLLAIGRHVPVKQFDIAIRAVALANKNAELAQLAIVGDGPERVFLTALAQSLGCGTTVSFPGWLEIRDVYRELRKADALVLTSRFDGFGVVVLEAMACGRPVLASTGVTAARDRDEGTGAVLLHPSADIDCLAEQIALLATDREQLRKASAASRSMAESWPPERAITIIGEIMERTERGQVFLQHRQQAAAVQAPRVERSVLRYERTETTAVATGGK